MSKKSRLEDIEAALDDTPGGVYGNRLVCAASMCFQPPYSTSPQKVGRDFYFLCKTHRFPTFWDKVKLQIALMKVNYDLRRNNR